MTEEASRTVMRRERDKLMRWAVHAFLPLMILGTIGGMTQFVLTLRLSREITALRAEQMMDQAERAQRLRTWETFRSQLSDSLAIREGELRLIRERIDQIERQHRVDRSQAQATRDRARQR